MSEDHVELDLLVIGGGINGTAIARDAAGRGFRVLLAEKDDLAEHTSSASSKLIHGGLRYLEMYDFGLVRHALIEREILLASAPHIIWPLRFILPHNAELRPFWFIRLGLFLYDHLGGRKVLPASRSVDLTRQPAGESLKASFRRGFEYSDCWVQDARFVVLNAMDAALHGASVKVRTEVTELERFDDHWVVTLHDRLSGESSRVRTRIVVNAAGPWVAKVLDLDPISKGKYGVRLVKGSHIVVPKLFDHEKAYIFQNGDGRIIFALPYEQEYTLIGTTDVDMPDTPHKPVTSGEEVEYLCAAASEYFEHQLSPDEVVWQFSGLRPLYEDDAVSASKVTRDYKLALDHDAGAPILSIYGGKITTCRRLAEESLELIDRHLPGRTQPWTAHATLPGGDIPEQDFTSYVRCLCERYPQLPTALLNDYARNYGTRSAVLLEGVANLADLGEHFGGLLYQREVDYLVEHEWAVNAEDILWRRSKKGLHVPADTAERLDAWLQRRYQHEAGAPLTPMA